MVISFSTICINVKPSTAGQIFLFCGLTEYPLRPTNFYGSSNQRNGNMLLAGFSKLHCQTPSLSLQTHTHTLSLSLSHTKLQDLIIAHTLEVVLRKENMWAVPHLFEWSQWSCWERRGKSVREMLMGWWVGTFHRTSLEERSRKNELLTYKKQEE